MLLTKQVLENYGACYEGKLWYTSNGEPTSVEETIEKLLDSDGRKSRPHGREKFDWSNWLLSRVLPNDDKIRYAIFAAELVLDIFEKEFPDDNRPRNAIKAARECLSNKDNVEAARVAADEAADAAREADYAAACAEADAARDAGYAARATANAARAARAVVNAICASRETTRAARETARAAGAAFVATYTKIINYGLSLIEKCDDYCCKTQD